MQKKKGLLLVGCVKVEGRDFGFFFWERGGRNEKASSVSSLAEAPFFSKLCVFGIN